MEFQELCFIPFAGSLGFVIKKRYNWSFQELATMDIVFNNFSLILYSTIYWS